MRKLEKLKLDRDLYGLSLPQCPDHKLPLLRHEDRLGFRDRDGNPEGCWDCPYVGVDGKECSYHVHEQLNVPWAGVDFGEEPNEVQKRRSAAEEPYLKLFGITSETGSSSAR